MEDNMTTANIYEMQNDPTCTTIRFFGFIDASTVEAIRPTLLEKLGDRQSDIVIDMRKVDFLDSHGVGLFVSLLKRASKGGGKLYIAGSEGQPASVLQMVGLNEKLVTHCTSVQEANADRAARKTVMI